MSLIKCPECGNEISDTSDICINCGYVLRKSSLSTIPFQKTKKFKIILSLVLLLVLSLIIFISTLVYKKISAEKREKMYLTQVSEYLNNIELFKDECFNGAEKCENLCNLTKKVWGNCIFEDKDKETDKYTMSSSGDFYEDFNLALSSLSSDSSVISYKNKIEQHSRNVKTLFLKLKEYPSDFEEYYKECSDLYSLFNNFINFSIEPSGSYRDYCSYFSDYDNNFITKYNSVSDNLEFLKIKHDID